MTVLREVVLADRLRKHVDVAIARDIDVVMRMRQILPEDIRILVHLDEPIAPRCVAHGYVDRE
jgi:hypothetical protein